MSNFIAETKNPETGKWENAQWLDDYYGKHKYAVRFPDGSMYSAIDYPELYQYPTAEERASMPQTEELSRRVNNGLDFGRGCASLVMMICFVLIVIFLLAIM